MLGRVYKIIGVCLLTIGCFIVPKECYAGYTTHDTGYLGGSPEIFNSGSYPPGNHNNPGYTFDPGLGSRDSIVSYTFRVRKSNKYAYPNTGHLSIRTGCWYDGYNSPIASSFYTIDVTSKTWSEPIVVNVPDAGANVLQAVLYQASNETNVAVEVEVLDIVYRKHYIDGVSLSIQSGKPVITATNNTVTQNMKLWIHNSVSGYVWQGGLMNNTAVSVTDTLAKTIPGQEFEYTIKFRFPRFGQYDYQYGAPDEQIINAGKLFVPLDYKLTEITQEIKAGTINIHGDTISAVRDSEGTVLSEARDAKLLTQAVNEKINALQATVTIMQNNIGGDISPPAVKIRTASGSVATSGNLIRVVLDISDNISTNFTYSLDKVTYQPMSANGIITLPVNSSGLNVIPVWVKDEVGNVGKGSLTIRKI